MFALVLYGGGLCSRIKITEKFMCEHDIIRVHTFVYVSTRLKSVIETLIGDQMYVWM